MGGSSLRLLKNKLKENAKIVLPAPSFVDTYISDYDIVTMNAKIKNYLTSLVYSDNSIIEDIRQLENELQETRAYNARTELENKILSKMRRLEMIQRGDFLKMYMEDTSVLIDKYKSGDKDVITEYIIRASKYCRVNVTKFTPKKIRHCLNCGEDISNIPADIDGFVECPECFSIDEQSYSDRNVDDNNNNSCEIVTPVTNDETILKLIDNYQGISPEFDDSLIPIIDEYIKVNRIFPSLLDEEIKYSSDGKVVGTSIPVMTETLIAMGYKKQVKYIHYICFMCLGWKLHNLTSIREDIVNRYNKLRVNFSESYKGKKAPNSYWFYRILQENGIECSYEDFNLPKSLACIRNLEETYQAISK